MRKGVGRSAAARLAALKPEVCRKYLEYLPYVKVRTTPGAWLATAIEREFGSPEGYVKRRERAGEEPQRTADREVRHAARFERLRQTLRNLEERQAAAFEEFVAAERTKAGRMAERLSGKGRCSVVEAYSDDEFRLTLLERWTRTRGKRNQPPQVCMEHTAT